MLKIQVNNIIRRERGRCTEAQLVQPELFKSVNNHKRILGHLSAVYCVCFDRTGRYILTVSELKFLKIFNFIKLYL